MSKLEQLQADLQAAHKKIGEFEARLARLRAEDGELISQRKELLRKHATGDGKASAKLDQVEARRSAINREIDGVALLCREERERVAKLEPEHNAACATEAAAKRHAYLAGQFEAAKLKAKGLCAAFDSANVAMADYCTLIDELLSAGGTWNNQAQALVEETNNHCSLILAQEKRGWRRPRIGWQMLTYVIRPLLPPEK